MKRAVVQVVVPGRLCCLRRWLVSESVSEGQERQIEALGPIDREDSRWLCSRFLESTWLGGIGRERWLQGSWLEQPHLETSERVEVLTWPMYFGKVDVHVYVGDQSLESAQLVGQASVTVNESPEPVRELRLAGEDENGNVMFSFRSSESLVQ